MARKTGSEREARTRANLGLSPSRPVDGGHQASPNPLAGVLGTRRRALPTGRAVVGGFMVAVAAVIVFGVALANSGTRTSQYAVAERVLAPGAIISAGDLTTVGADLPGSARASVFERTASLIGRTLAVAVGPGQLIEASDLVPRGSNSGLRPVSVAVDPDSLAAVTPGDTVDVLATTTSNGTTQVSVVMRGASLIDVGTVGNSLTSGTGTGSLVTLGVGNLAEAEAVVAAARTGTVTLIMAEPSDGVGPGAGS